MRLNLILTFIFFLIFTLSGFSQKVSGYVYEILENSKTPLVGANVYQARTTNGTSTDENGYFILKLKPVNHSMLVFSYVGYQNDTVHVQD